MLELVQTNLLTPAVLAFGLGALAARLRSDLRLPDALYASLSIYLLLAIGLKGGAALSRESLAEIGVPVLATLLLGAAVPLWCYPILRRLGRFGVSDAAALAAHYGSISIVTFVAALSYLDSLGIGYEGYVPALAALLEVPGIVIALLLARRAQGGGALAGDALRETLAGRSIVLLVGGLAIGWLSGEAGLATVAAFFVDPFPGALVLFLLELGRVAASRLQDLRAAGSFLPVFALAAPIVHAALGVAIGASAGLSEGGSLALGVLAASASYIAAPAAVRLALPDAKPSLYLTASLGITFPFNLVVGIPLYHAFAVWLVG